jgi:hypothetical protein
MAICCVTNCDNLGVVMTTKGAMCYKHASEHVAKREAPEPPTTTAPMALLQYAWHEQMYLWDDLINAIDLSRNHVWSIGCDSALYRLCMNLKVAGPISPAQAPWGLVVGKVYATVIESLGLSVPKSPEVSRTMEATFAHTVGTREYLIEKYRETCQMIRGLSYTQFR